MQAAIDEHNRRTSLSTASSSSTLASCAARGRAVVTEELGDKRTRAHDTFKHGQPDSRHGGSVDDECAGARVTASASESSGRAHRSNDDDDDEEEEEEEYDCRGSTHRDEEARRDACDQAEFPEKTRKHDEANEEKNKQAGVNTTVVQRVLRRMFALRPRETASQHPAKESAGACLFRCDAYGVAPGGPMSAGDVRQEWREVTVRRSSASSLWGLFFCGNVLVRCEGYAGVPYPALVTQLNGREVHRHEDVAALLDSVRVRRVRSALARAAYDEHEQEGGLSRSDQKNQHREDEEEEYKHEGGVANDMDGTNAQSVTQDEETACLELHMRLTYAATSYELVVDYQAMDSVAATLPSPSMQSRTASLVERTPSTDSTSDDHVLNLLLPRGQVAAELTALLPGVCVTMLDGVRVSSADELRAVLHARIAQARAQQSAKKRDDGVSSGGRHGASVAARTSNHKEGGDDGHEAVSGPVNVCRGLLRLAVNCATLAGVTDASEWDESRGQRGCSLLHVYDGVA